MIEPWSEPVERRLREETTPSTEAIVRQILRALAGLGCDVRVPPANRTDYLNIAPPPGVGGSSVCCVHVRSASTEFRQKDSFDIATERGLALRHVRAANRAALTPSTSEAVATIVQMAQAVIAGR